MIKKMEKIYTEFKTHSKIIGKSIIEQQNRSPDQPKIDLEKDRKHYIIDHIFFKFIRDDDHLFSCEGNAHKVAGFLT